MTRRGRTPRRLCSLCTAGALQLPAHIEVFMQKSHIIGSRDFYRRTMAIAVPIMIQNFITNFVGMLDNIMVGRVGTDSMSGVSIVNQLLFVFNLCIFGGLAGVGIFTAQFYGKGDDKGVRYTFRFKVILALVITLLGVLILHFGSSTFIWKFLHEDGGSGDAEMTFHYAKEYLFVMYFGLLPFAATNVYAGTMRETGETVTPMRAGVIAVLVNLVGNYVLIYGKFGAPALGVVGAALATVISRFVEAVYVVVWMHTHKERNTFLEGVFSSFRIPAGLVGNIIVKGTPLLLNEALWSAGMTVLNQNYSMRGLSVVAAMNISSTISNLFSVAFFTMGNATAIMIGQELGTGDTEKVKVDADLLTWFSVFLCAVSGMMLFTVSGIFPRIYNTSDEVRRIATSIIRIGALCMPIYAYMNAAYFILRSGGKTIITFLFDSCFAWVFSIPLAYVLAHFTSVPITEMYLAVQLLDLVKCVIGYVLVKKGVWINNITTYAGQAD